jgi:Fe2+ transport system protein FeoA
MGTSARRVTHSTEPQLQLIHTCIMPTDLELIFDRQSPGEHAMPPLPPEPLLIPLATRPLCELPVGDSAVVQDSVWHAHNSALLESYGFFPGVKVTRIGSAPQGDPLIFRLDRRLVAVRRETASHILVSCEHQ